MRGSVGGKTEGTHGNVKSYSMWRLEDDEEPPECEHDVTP